MKNLLEGVKVVELGSFMAIPVVARFMADWGAEVIKVEPPKGEPWRYIGNSYGLPYTSDCNPIFQVPNGNKRDIALNLKTAEGKEILDRLLSDADVFLTNTRPNALAKLGYDYDRLKDKCPRLIMAHFSGYGTEGPDKDLPGYDIASYWAKTGMPLEWATKEGGPFRPLPGFGDTTVGTVILSGVLAALYRREKTGRGEFVRSSLYGSALWFNNCGLISAQYQKSDYPRSRFEQPSIYHVIYSTADGDYFTFSATRWDDMYADILREMKLDRYIGDPRFSTLKGGRQHLDECVPIFDEAFRKMSTEAVRDMFVRLDVVNEFITNPRDVASDEQAWANGYLGKVSMENGEEVVLPMSPVQFEDARPLPFRLAPGIGEHSVEILREYGYNDAAIEALLASGSVIAQK
ncbi:MAG: CoA transferase [Clostridiales Family XIII bacterium]|jgi:crotonobetainyl-CoA:carnitine CoA-transferase CaiB-like acyl-CoA transferase|nr:CoA transferase [Clostridiales Family XIII bacterium]